MKVVCLISGGKDSCFNMMKCVAMNHQIIALANLFSTKTGESDSYMYQTVGCEAIEMYSLAMQIPLFRREIRGSSKEIDLIYHENKEDEVEDLFLLLQSIKKEVHFEGVSCGAILSDYQRIRVENVCGRLGLVSLSYLWRQDQKQLLQEMIDHDLNAILIKTAALGLVPKLHLGKTLHEMKSHLFNLNSKYGSHVCGEGGEYETFTLDCPLFKKRIVLDESEVILHSDDGVTSVAYLHLKSLHLEEKNDSTFDYSALVPRPIQNQKTLREIADEPALQKHFSWIPPLSNVKHDLFSLLSICSSKSYLCISNLIASCQTYEERDIVRSTEKTFSALAEILQQHCHDFSNLLKVNLSLVNMSHFATINSVYKTYFKYNPPVRVCVSPSFEISENNKLLFAFDCISCKSLSVKTMHVQGISHWAPANIGPYSQSKLIEPHCYVAGQIGLIPGTMKLTDEGIEMEALLSLQHVQSVLLAMNPSFSWSNTFYCICYVISNSYVNTVKSVWENEVDEDILNKIVYVVVPSLPRGCRVEWEVVTRNGKNSFTPIMFDRSDNVDYINGVQSLLTLCEERNHEMPLQARVAYSREGVSFHHLEDVCKILRQHRSSLPSIAWLPVQAIYEHSRSSSLSMALVCSFTDHVVEEDIDHLEITD